jgi:hypothetical protein
MFRFDERKFIVAFWAWDLAPADVWVQTQQ